MEFLSYLDSEEIMRKHGREHREVYMIGKGTWLKMNNKTQRVRVISTVK